MGGVNSVNAYTLDDLTSAGWEKVTSITDVENNLYMFVEPANTAALGQIATNERPVYAALTDPASTPGLVWVLEGSGTSYKLKSAQTGNYFFSGSAGWNDSMSGTQSTEFTFTLNDGKYDLSCATGYVGWWNEGTAVGTLPESAAANKQKDNPSAINYAQGFYVYSISRTAYVAQRAALLSSATKASPADVTSFILNNDFSTNSGNGWIRTQTSVGNQQFGQGTMESWNNNNVSVTQDLAEVPNGLYKLTVDMISGNDTKNAYVYAKGENEVNGEVVSAVTSKGDYATMSSEVVGNTLNADNINVTGNKLTVGFKDPSVSPLGWIVADNFKLYYYGPTVAGNAVALPASGDMAADTWYYLDIPAAAEYNATATTLGDIVYTTDGATLIEDAGSITANFAATGNNLTKARYYVKSASANNLAIAVAADTYALNDATKTTSITDGQYLNSLTTFVVTYPDAETTSAAELALVGVNTASLKKGGVEVATGTLAANNAAKTLTATFSDVTLDLASTYTIEIAAGVFGYAGEAVNEAVSVSFNTGIIANSVYYFKKKGEFKYLTRGGNYGTETVVDNYGLSFEAVLQNDGTYTMKNVDHSLSANTGKYLNTYTDGAAYKWTIAEATDGYYLKFTNGQYLKTNEFVYTDDNGNTNSYFYQAGTENSAEAIVWEILTKEQYAASLAEKKNSEIATLATAAGISATTLAELESQLAANYGTSDMTSSISNPTVKSNLDGWTTVHYAGNAQATPGADGNCAEVWNGQGGVKQTIYSLPAGLYKITVSATWRPGNLDAATRVGAEANTTAWIYANNNITQLKSWYEGGGTINNRAGLVSNAANYLNTVYVYLNGSEDLTIGIAAPSFCVEPWMPFYNWTLTRYEAKATQAEKTALADAIDAAEAKTLGFETGEYAPYNNVEALTALAAAKAIDTETASGSAVVNATTALSGATWTANSNDVECVYNGDFAEGQGSPAADIQQYGWTRTNAWGQFKNDGLGSSTAYYNQPGSLQYGNAGVYTMPLKAQTIYRLQFKYAKWDGDFAPTVSVLNEGNGMAAQTFENASSSYKNGYNSVDMVFVTATAGNYVLSLSASSNYVITGVSITKAANQYLEFVDGAVPAYAPGTYPTVKINRTLTAGNWATAVYPFAVSGVDNIAVLDSYDAENGKIGFTTAAASTANVPFLMRSTSAKSEISLSNVEVAAAAATDATASEASLKGVYTATTVEAGEGVYNYVLSSNTIYKVGENAATVNPYRAYIQLTQPTAARALSFYIDGEETTGIEGIAADGMMNGNVYNLNGQRVESPRKGLYIKNGQKVVVK